MWSQGHLTACPQFRERLHAMAEKEKGAKREEVQLERIVLSNMYSIEALIDVLAEKGLVTREEVLKRMEKVVEEGKYI